MTRHYAEPIRWRAVESSNVALVGWDRHGSMYVWFRDGALYEYKGVSRQRVVACSLAKSVGSYLNRRIKPNFPAVRLVQP